MILKPLGDRVLVKPVERPTETESGLQLVEHRKPEQVGTVVAVGAECHRCVAPGDVVVFSWMAGQELQLDEADGGRYFTLRHDDLLAVIEDV